MIVHGRVVDVRAGWVDGRRSVDTFVTIAADDYLKGNLGETRHSSRARAARSGAIARSSSARRSSAQGTRSCSSCSSDTGPSLDRRAEPGRVPRRRRRAHRAAHGDDADRHGEARRRARAGRPRRRDAASAADRHVPRRWSRAGDRRRSGASEARAAAAAVVAAAARVVAPALDAYLKLGTRLGTEADRAALRRRFRSATSSPTATCAGVTAPQLQQSVARALASWAAVPDVGLSSQFVGFTGPAPLIGRRAERDRLHRIAPTSIACSARPRSPSTRVTGEVIESDIFLNSTFSWSVADGGEAGPPGRRIDRAARARAPPRSRALRCSARPS